MEHKPQWFNTLSILRDMFMHREYNNVTIKFITVNFFLYRYIMIPANRGKDNKDQGMALKGTGGSSKISD